MLTFGQTTHERQPQRIPATCIGPADFSKALPYPKMQFDRRIAVIVIDAHSGFEFTQAHVHSEHAKSMIGAGLAVVHRKEKRVVKSIRRTHIATAVQRGSFGIQRRNWYPGDRDRDGNRLTGMLSAGVIFEHHSDLHDRAA